MKAKYLELGAIIGAVVLLLVLLAFAISQTDKKVGAAPDPTLNQIIPTKAPDVVEINGKKYGCVLKRGQDIYIVDHNSKVYRDRLFNPSKVAYVWQYVIKTGELIPLGEVPEKDVPGPVLLVMMNAAMGGMQCGN